MEVKELFKMLAEEGLDLQEMESLISDAGKAIENTCQYCFGECEWIVTSQQTHWQPEESELFCQDCGMVQE